MFHLKLINHVFFSLLFFSINAYSFDVIELKKVTLIKDSINDVNGLDNPRTALLSTDNRKIFVASADDDALAIFDVDKNFKLTLSQIFKNNDVISGLRGATRVVLSADGLFAYVVSFYDSSIVTFKKNALGAFEYKQTISDNVKWFAETGAAVKVTEEVDKRALLGAYDITKTSDNQQLLVASSASNALSIFSLNEQGNIDFKQAIRDSQNSEYGLSGAVSVIASPNNKQIIVAGYTENAITVFNRTPQGDVVFSQTLRNKTLGITDMVNPHRLVMSADSQFLYVTCGGGNSVVAFAKNSSGKFEFLQTISNNQQGVSGLAGGVDITLSPDQKILFVAAETDNAVVIFERSIDGLLQFNSILQNQDIAGASSVNVSADGQHLFVTAGNEGNSLSVYQIKR